MSTRYTGSDIEVHLGDLTTGMATDGLDSALSNTRAGALVQAAIEQAYPQYRVSVVTRQDHGAWFQAVGYPDDVEPDALQRIAHVALGDDASAWAVMAATEPGTEPEPPHAPARDTLGYDAEAQTILIPRPYDRIEDADPHAEAAWRVITRTARYLRLRRLMAAPQLTRNEAEGVLAATVALLCGHYPDAEVLGILLRAIAHVPLAGRPDDPPTEQPL